MVLRISKNYWIATWNLISLNFLLSLSKSYPHPITLFPCNHLSSVVHFKSQGTPYYIRWSTSFLRNFNWLESSILELVELFFGNQLLLLLGFVLGIYLEYWLNRCLYDSLSSWQSPDFLDISSFSTLEGRFFLEIILCTVTQLKPH